MARLLVRINGIPADLKPDAEVVFDFQACDVTKPETIQAGYSNVFELPDTAQNRKIAGHSSDVNSASEIPYRKNRATVEDSGHELIPEGIATIEDGYYPGKTQNWQIFSGNMDFFDKLGDKSLQDLSFPDFDHGFNPINTIQSFRNNAEDGYVYSIIRRGKAGQSVQYYWFDLYPSVFCLTILERIFEEAGFSYEWLREPGHLMEKLILPSPNPPSLSQKYRDARRSYLSAKGWKIDQIATPVGDPDVYITRRGDYVIPYNNDVSDGFTQGFMSLWNKDTHTYTADATYWVDVYVYVPFFAIRITAGRITVKVSIRLNGQEIQKNEQSFTGVSINFAKVYEINAAKLQMNAGDRLQVVLSVIRDTSVAQYNVVIADANSVIIDVKVNEAFPPGAIVRLNEFLPDMKQKDFIKSIIFLFCLVAQKDSYAKKITLKPLDTLIDQIPEATDVSEWVDDSDMEVSFAFSEFGQNSWIKWTYEGDISAFPFSGSLKVENTRLPSDKDIITLPYHVTDSLNGIPFIENYKVSDSQPVESNEIRYDVIQQKPRLMVNATVERDIKILDNEGNPFNLTIADRPIPRFAPDLDIQRKIIPLHYKAYKVMLNNARVVKVKAILPVWFIQNLDHTKPVLVKTNKIPGAFFYLNRISEWADNRKCILHLIRL